MYKILKDVATGDEYGVLRLSDMASIPLDPSNSDYAEYLAWVAAGNTAEPAE